MSTNVGGYWRDSEYCVVYMRVDQHTCMYAVVGVVLVCHTHALYMKMFACMECSMPSAFALPGCVARKWIILHLFFCLALMTAFGAHMP